MAIDITPAVNAGLVTPPLPARTDRDGNAARNAILLSVPDEEFSALRPFLEPIAMPRYRVLYEQGEKIEQVYFPNEGMISLVIVTADGRCVEVGISGNEGAVGVPLAFGLEYSTTRAISQLPGSGLQISSGALNEVFPQCEILRLMIQRYVLMQQVQVAQIAACNRLH